MAFMNLPLLALGIILSIKGIKESGDRMRRYYLEDKKVKKVIVDRMVREIEQKVVKEKRQMPVLYLLGYRTACQDIYYDLFGLMPMEVSKKMDKIINEIKEKKA